MWLKVGSGPDEGKKALVEGEVFALGSSEDSHFRLSDEGVAPAHAFFKTLADGRVELHDLGSEAGTFVNGERVEGSVLLLGDEDIRVGRTVIVASLGDPEAASAELDEEVEALREAIEGDDKRHVAEAPPPEPAAPQPGEPAPVATRRIYSGRAAVAYLREMRKTMRRALALAGLAIAAALAVLVLTLTGVIGGDDDGVRTEEIVDGVSDATVLIRNPDVGSSGSGWVVDAEKGLVITNFHVVNGGDRVEAGPPDDLKEAEILAAAPCEDLALLEIDDPEGLKQLELGSQDDLDQGERVVAVGYPANASLEDKLTATEGVVSVARSDLKAPTPDAPSYANVIQTDAALNAGNSGGPLVNADRQLVGVNTAVLTALGGQPIQGQGYAIGVDRVKELIGDMREGTSRGYLGGGLDVMKPAQRRNRSLPPGMVVVGPAAGGNVPKGVKVLVTSVNGANLDGSFASWCSATGDIETDEQATLSVIDKPGGSPKDVSVEFE